jgi:hypothetical protein
MLNYFFTNYGSIAPEDLDRNFESMHNARDPQQPVETLFKQIQNVADYYEAGGAPIGETHQISVEYTKIFTTGSFMSTYRHWNEKEDGDKTCVNFKAHFTVALPSAQADTGRISFYLRVPFSQCLHGRS